MYWFLYIIILTETLLLVNKCVSNQIFCEPHQIYQKISYYVSCFYTMTPLLFLRRNIDSISTHLYYVPIYVHTTRAFFMVWHDWYQSEFNLQNKSYQDSM